MGTSDVGTRDEGLEDIKYGTRGRVGWGRRDVKYRDAGTRDVNDYCKSRRRPDVPVHLSPSHFYTQPVPALGRACRAPGEGLLHCVV